MADQTKKLSPGTGRRLFMKGVAAQLLLSGCTVWPPRASTRQLPIRAIDPHCHVWNASDMPAWGFVYYVLLGHDEEFGHPVGVKKKIYDPLVAFYVNLIFGKATTAREELELLSDEGLEATARAKSDEEFEDDLAKTLDFFLNRPTVASQLYGVDAQPLRDMIVKDLKLTPDGSEYNSRTAARRAMRSRSVLFAPLVFVRHMRQNRSFLIKEMNRIYGGEARVGLFTPALIDMKAWLAGEPGQECNLPVRRNTYRGDVRDDQRSKLIDQLILMDKLQQKRFDTPFHCMVPFDPWRQARDRQKGRSEHSKGDNHTRESAQQLSALGMVQWAIDCLGFVGVKIYPAMGFKPLENGKFDLYPCRAIKEFRQFHKELDKSLEELYRWCVNDENDVPILTHAWNSQAPADGLGKRANPKYWRPVLKKNEFSKLRICLAHNVGLKPNKKGELPKWTHEFGKTMNLPDRAVYADISDLGDILLWKNNLSKYARGLRDFVDDYDEDCNRLMYGSDFAALSRTPRYARYPDRMNALLDAAGFDEAQKHRFFQKNALDFLGLRPGRKAYERLREYYARHGLSFERISSFSQSTKT